MNTETVTEEGYKSFWYGDWSFPLFVGLLSAAVFAGTHTFIVHGVGNFSDIAVVALLTAGLEEGGAAFGAAAAFGASFLFARVLEGSLVGVLDIGGSIQTGVGIGIPAVLLSMGITAPLDHFGLSLIVGGLIGVLIGYVVIGLRKFTVGQSNSTFGADIMMGAGNQSGRFMGPLLIISAAMNSVPVGLGAIIGAVVFYKFNKPIPGGAIIGAMLLGMIFS